jgi:predicted aldo/keto reductase-like oxidoreductase
MDKEYLMQYRPFGKVDFRVSALGFGCMRLPILNGDYAQIDEPEALRMLRHAIDCGVNYVDTAYGYHRGNSERFVGRALLDGYRQKVALATKLPVWLVKEPADFERLFTEQIGRLQTEHIDFYLLHALGAKSWHTVYDLGVLDWIEKTRLSGRIHHIGFSFHDTFDAFKEIVDAYAGWDFAQIQYNYMDINEQAGTAGLKYAAQRGMAMVVMEPLLGGKLVRPPEAVQALWDSAPLHRSPADWALQWLWNQPEVSVVLSGMSAYQQVEENLVSAGASATSQLSPADLALVEKVRAKTQELCAVPCTHCDYCQPCPNKINIPRLFELYNNASMYNTLDESRREYARMPMEERADMCLDCDECEDKCPQHIPISAWMPQVHEALRGR